MRYRRIRLALLVMTLISLLYSCNHTKTSSDSSVISSDSSSENSQASSIDEARINKVNLYSAPSGVALYQEVTMQVNGKNVDLYLVKVNNSQIWNGLAPSRIDSAVAIIQLEGKVTVTIKTSYDLNYETIIRPLSYNIRPYTAIDQRTFSFEIFNTGSYVIEPNGDRTKSIHLFVNSIDENREMIGNSNVIYFGPGLHDSANDSRIINNTVSIASNQTVFIDYGAVVRARFVASNATNISIIGGGIIDGSIFPRIAGQTSGNTQTIPIDFNYCKNVTLKDITLLDPAGWTVNFYFIEDSLIDNIKIITSRSNGDGISLQSNKDIEVKNSFVRSWDDSLVVKNYPMWNDKTKQGTTQNISFTNMMIWTDLAQCMEIGYETVGEVMDNITFDNITVLHNYHKPVISIHNGNNANIENVTFKNITIEDAAMGMGDAGSNNQLIDFNVAFNSTWSSQHAVTSTGSIDTVLVENVKVVNGNNIIPIRVKGSYDTRSGYESSHFVNNVTLRNISIKGSVVTSSYPYVQTNEYANNLVIENDASTISGATLIRRWNKEELKLFGNNIEVRFDGALLS